MTVFRRTAGEPVPIKPIGSVESLDRYAPGTDVEAFLAYLQQARRQLRLGIDAVQLSLFDDTEQA